ncbi:MAG: ABC transporter permease [Rothia sp. (in: high G+C Gram-positive bacteria)]|nr:ABC transporter permease [Rothia sp. (in: high G+C Gram-positive bacteria)]
MIINFSHILWYLAGVFMLVSLTFLLAKRWRIEIGAIPYIAIARAIVQIGLIALVLRGVINFPWIAPAFFAVMLTTATLTSGKHARTLFHGRKAAGLGITVASIFTIAAIFLLRLVDFSTQNLMAMGGIIIGGTMTIVTLTARNFTDRANTRALEIEGWWALGATNLTAFDEVRRQSIKEALTPGLDQTKATGLVTLPGTFVGALMGGAAPLAAAQMQIAVLAGQTLSGLIAALIFTEIICRSPQLPATASH